MRRAQQLRCEPAVVDRCSRTHQWQVFHCGLGRACHNMGCPRHRHHQGCAHAKGSGLRSITFCEYWEFLMLIAIFKPFSSHKVIQGNTLKALTLSSAPLLGVQHSHYDFDTQ